MIDSFFVKNFKSYKEAEMPLSSLTFLIGANASGKSNILEALRILSWLAKGIRLDDLQKSLHTGNPPLIRGQELDLFSIFDLQYPEFEIGCQSDNSQWNRLSIEIGMSGNNMVVIKESVSDSSESIPLYRVDGDPNPHTDEVSVMYNNFKKGKNKPHIPCSNRMAIFYQMESPGRFNKEHEESQRIIPAVVREFRENLKKITFLEPRPSLMRGYSYKGDGEIKEDGSNLSGVLYNICIDSEKKQRLLQFVRSLPEQNITGISFIKTPRNDVMVGLTESFGVKEKHQKKPMDAPLLSDGTLRVLAVGAALLSVREDSLVIIEEIDNGVHPSRAEELIKQIRDIAKERNLRVLLTSHNPALLDALPDESLGDVLCCYRDPDQGDSRIVRLGDMERFPELMSQGTLGQLMTKRILDRFLKDKTTSEERLNSSLSWLEDFKKEITE